LLIKRRLLDIIRQYLSKGNSLTATIEMTEVSRIVNVPVLTAGTSVSLSEPDLIRGAPKVHTNFIANFSGDVVNSKSGAGEQEPQSNSHNTRN